MRYEAVSTTVPRSFGARVAVAATTINVHKPPMIIDGTKPNKRAVTPDSKAPISLDEIMNIELTDETRPRILSGVKSCIIVPLIITLILSNAPSVNRKNKDR